MSDYTATTLAVIAGAVFGFVLCVFIVAMPIDIHWKRTCVEHGAAEYNQTTGAWQWKEPTK